MKGLLKTGGQFLLKTKLFWGLAALYGAGVILSPINRKGANIFLMSGNQADVLRQVSNNGIIAVGMTLVILTGGIDLSVGSMMSLGCMLCAMLLTLQGWTAASSASIPILAFVAFSCAPTWCRWSPRACGADQPKPFSARAGLLACLA